jgi:hypothetical protein
MSCETQKRKCGWGGGGDCNALVLLSPIHPSLAGEGRGGLAGFAKFKSFWYGGFCGMRSVREKGGEGRGGGGRGGRVDF